MRVVISWGPVSVGRKGDHFLPHRELPNMNVALTLGRTGWGRFSGNHSGFNARCDILGLGLCGAGKLTISCPTKTVIQVPTHNLYTYRFHVPILCPAASPVLRSLTLYIYRDYVLVHFDSLPVTRTKNSFLSLSLSPSLSLSFPCFLGSFLERSTVESHKQIDSVKNENDI